MTEELTRNKYQKCQNMKSECVTLNLQNGITISVYNNVNNDTHELKIKNNQKLKQKWFCCFCRSQTNSLLLILSVYIVIFSVASVILIISLLKLQNSNESDKFYSYIKTESDYKINYNSVLKEVDSLFFKANFIEFMWPFRSSIFNCSNLSEVKKFHYMTSGWTKNVFSFKHSGKEYALKTVNLDGIDMKYCIEKHPSKICLDKASSKIYKEYILSRELSHSNIVKVFAWCFTTNNISNSVAIVTELCSPIDTVMLLQMTFQKRLKIMLDLSLLMAYLADSPLGSIALNDFQRQQFVLCKNTLKLTDLDDLSIEEPKCSENEHCLQKNLIPDVDDNSTNSFDIKCINNMCLGYNEKKNVVNTYKHFVNLFLNISIPHMLKQDIDILFKSYISTWNAKVVLKKTELLYKKYNKFKSLIHIQNKNQKR